MNEWNKLDLHVHTQPGNIYNNKKDAKDTGRYYSLKNLIERNKVNDLKLISITNHNLINIIDLLKATYISNKTGTNVIPGIELDVFIHSDKRYHIIVVFSEYVNIIDINIKLKNYLLKNGNNYLNIDDLFDLIQGTECIIIPHGCKNPHGMKPTQDDEIDINDAIDLVNIITSSSSLNVLFEHTQPHFSESFKSNLQNKAKNMWLSVEEMDELEKRVGGEYIGSDYRFSEFPIKKESRALTKIWANPTFRGLQISSMFPEERIRSENNIVARVNYISKIVISSSKYFSQSDIQLSSGLNSIIGESASGKTALLDIITMNLKGENAVKDKDYTELCKDLNVRFYNQDGFEIKQGDINIVVADNLYDSIRTAHDTGDNNEILKLFNFNINDKSKVIEKYKRKINDYINNNIKILNSKSSGNHNFSNVKERSNVLLINGLQNNSEFIINIPLYKNLQEIKKYEDANKVLSDYIEIIEIVKEKTTELKLKLLDLKIENKLEEKIRDIEVEIKRISRIISKNFDRLNLCKIIYNKLNTIVTSSNNKINQKNSYIQNTKKIVYEDTTKLINDIKEYKVNQMKNNLINLTFPEKEIVNELEQNNTHKYIKVEYENIDKLLLIEENSGIFDIKGIKRILSDYYGNIIKSNDRVKCIINKIQENNRTPIIRIDNLLREIISKSKIKIGFPGKEKIFISDLTPGLTAKMYIDYLFNVKILDGFNNVVIFDQPENDVDKAFIYEELIPKMSSAKFNIQIIITSHEPLLVINGDSNQIIKAEKNKHIIKYSSYKLDEYLDQNTVTNIISKYVDGNITAVKNRYEIYVGGKNEISDII